MGSQASLLKFLMKWCKYLKDIEFPAITICPDFEPDHAALSELVFNLFDYNCDLGNDICANIRQDFKATILTLIIPIAQQRKGTFLNFLAFFLLKKMEQNTMNVYGKIIQIMSVGHGSLLMQAIPIRFILNLNWLIGEIVN